MKPFAGVRRAALALAVAALGSQVRASGNTWIVDAAGGPGSHSTAIPPAIAAAQPGDKVFVRGGVYGAFTLSKPLVVRGESNTIISGAVRVQDVPNGAKAALSTLVVEELELFGCGGTVLVEGLRTPSSGFDARGLGSLVSIQSCKDVRLRGCVFQTQHAENDGADGMFVWNSSVELVSSILRGQHGKDSGCGAAGDGGNGLVASGTAWLSIAISEITGGRGGELDSCGFGGYAGDGGRAVSLTSGPRARIAGAGVNVILGGDGGFGFLGGCGVMNGGSDGHAGEGLFVGGVSSASHSGVAVNGGWGWDCGFAAAFQTQSGGVITAADPSAPTLELTIGTPGSTLPLRLRAPTGSVARVWLGRTMLKPAPQSTAVGLMTKRARLVELGVVPANGEVLTSLLLPGGLDSGDIVSAQADVVTVGGQLLFSNSITFTMP
jgi:hypothetical protein